MNNNNAIPAADVADESRLVESAAVESHARPDPVCGRKYRHRVTGVEAYFVTRRLPGGHQASLYEMENVKTEVKFLIEPWDFDHEFEAVRS